MEWQRKGNLGGTEEKCPTANLYVVLPTQTMNVGFCHHGMARPRVADGGTASNMEGSCE